MSIQIHLRCSNAKPRRWASRMRPAGRWFARRTTPTSRRTSPASSDPAGASMDVPVNVGGSVTIISLVVLGIFVYPWLLKKRGGALVMAVLTVALAVLYYLFDNRSGVASSTSGVLAIVLALLPAGTALLVWSYQRKSAPKQLRN